VNDPGLVIYGSELKINPMVPPQDNTELMVYILTVGAETEGQPREARQAVCSVIMNRYYQQKESFGLTLKDICLNRSELNYDFQCWRDYLKHRDWFENPDKAKLTMIYQDCMLHYLHQVNYWRDISTCYYKSMDVEDNKFWNRFNHVERIGSLDFYSDPSLARGK